MTLSRDAVLAAHDCALEAVEVPEWGGTVYVRSFSGAVRAAFFAECIRRKKELGDEAAASDLDAWLLVRSLCDENGTLLFAPGDEAALFERNAAIISRLTEVTMHVNGLSPKAVETIEKN